MCTLTIASRVFPEAPIVVAANRDEAHDRPSAPPAVVDEDRGIVAPLDERAGGTWIGYNAEGVFAGVANRWVDGPAGERSRGLLVRDALHAPNADAAIATVERQLAGTSYAGFNLLIADTGTAVLLEWDGRLRVTELEPGLHVVMNAGFDDRFDAMAAGDGRAAEQAESAQRLRHALSPGEESTADWLDRAAERLGDHELGACVHRDGFGTRSSSLIAVGRDGSRTYRFADGPPCETAYRDVQL